MNYSDDENDVKDLDKKVFDEHYAKQMKYSKKIFLIIGIIILVLAIICLIISLIYMIELIIISIIYFILGSVFLILSFALSEKGNYNRYQKRINRYGYLNIYDLNAKVAILEEKNKNLESKIKELEDEIKKLK